MPPKKKTGNKLVNFRAPESLMQELDRLAEAVGEDRSTLIRQYLREGIWRMEANLAAKDPPARVAEDGPDYY